MPTKATNDHRLDHTHAVERVLQNAGFMILARVYASARMYDVAATRPDIGPVLARCVLRATAKDVSEAKEMVKAGDFAFALVVSAQPVPKIVDDTSRGVACTFGNLRDALSRASKGRVH